MTGWLYELGGIISHVPELKKWIDVCLEVVSGGWGCMARLVV